MPVQYHDLTAADDQAMQATRAELAKQPRLAFGPQSREMYDQIIGQSPTRDGVTYEAGEVGGVPGWWCRPQDATDGSVALYFHGGGYVIGSAQAYLNFVGHIAAEARVATFIADYALAPERPFPAAYENLFAALKGAEALGYQRIALCGDSAGGGLVLSWMTSGETRASVVGIAALSPFVDLTASGSSMRARASFDPLLSFETVSQAAATYLAGASPRDPRVAVLDAPFTASPPVRIDVGLDEVLLDDTLRFYRKADADGLRCDVHVWQGMIHVFPASFAYLQAGAEALKDIGAFLSTSLRAPGA